MNPFLLLLCLLLAASPARAGENVLRNGSFEGGLLYWHNLNPEHHRLVRGAAKVGDHALDIRKEFVISAPFVCARGKAIHVGFYARAETPGDVHVQIAPSAREVAVNAKRLWSAEATHKAKVGTEWTWVNFTSRADVPPDGFWPLPHYMVQIGAGGKSVQVDGVTVFVGDERPAAYTPRRAVEITASCPDLPGYRVNGNVFPAGASVRVSAHASNPGDQPRAVVLRWQLIDFEGVDPVGVPVDRAVTLPAGGSLSETVTLPLVTKGCVLARVSVHADARSPALDSSDHPLTSLPYPMAAIAPDARERFGGSFAGATGMVEKLQSIGFRWIRWRPHMNWEDHQPDGPDSWVWFDDVLREQEAHGFTSHMVMYGWPKWIMDKPDNAPGRHPLPRDMRWKADDPRWADLSVETAWDCYVKKAVDHYRGRALVYEIENEPEFDKWEKHHPEYAAFTKRTARLIKRTDPEARVMVNNVYGIPSPVNAALFKSPDGLKDIDILSWHDYHAGWLTDAKGIRRMRQNLDEAGGAHVELWFNEGWAFTNTAVDEPPACTGLTSARSTVQQMASVAEMTVSGQEKTILFHTGYETHGMSFWDYSGPGTMLWDWYDNPLPLLAAWNTLTHHISLSDEVGLVRPLGANLAIFEDLRNRRGVMVAYADRDAKEDAVIELPGDGLTVEDLMGNPRKLDGRRLTLPKSGRLVYVYDGTTSGKAFLAQVEGMDRRHASFVSAGPVGASARWSLPPSWEGTTKGESTGSVAMADGKPIWKLEQVWPPDPTKAGNYHPMVWTGTDWNVKENGFGGQPGAGLKDGALEFGTRAAHGQPPRARVASLAFVAPAAGTYRFSGSASSRIWDGKNTTRLLLLKRAAGAISEVASLKIPHQGRADLADLSAPLQAGEELVLVPLIEGMYAGGTLRLEGLSLSLGITATATPAASAEYRLPPAWEGVAKGSPEGNPVLAGGQPIWRVDQLWPTDPIFTANYRPMVWDGGKWAARDHTHSGHPSATQEGDVLQLAAMGPWNGPDVEFVKAGALAFLAPADGTYTLTATASCHPWTGGAKMHRLGLFKKDAQRAAELQTFELPADGTPVTVSLRVDLSAGHELLLLPRVLDYNNAANFRLEGVRVRRGD